MEERRVDVAVIGAGTAGLGAYRAAKAAGADTVLIEQGPWGTTCVRVGCMPSKLLLVAASAARDARRAGVFGVNAGPVQIDGDAMMIRMREQRQHFLDGILKSVAAIPAQEKIDGRARFTGPSTLVVDEKVRIGAKAIVIATGSSPSIPDAFAALRERVLTSDTIFDLQTLPASLAVVGAGPVGVELAVAFARLGVAVTLFDETRRIGGLKDEEVSGVARNLLGAELEMQLGVSIEAEPAGSGVRLAWHGDARRSEKVFDEILVAAGRPPTLGGLDLQATGLDLDDGVPQHDRHTLRCGDSMIFIAGDAGHELPVLHEASRQGRLAGRNAARPQDMERNARPPALSIVFTSPDMASIGTPLCKLGDDTVVGCCDFDAGRGTVEDRSGGMIRLYANRGDGRLLGGEMVGAGVEHLAQLFALMIQQDLSVEQALRFPFYHPTYEEDLQACLKDLRDKVG